MFLMHRNTKKKQKSVYMHFLDNLLKTHWLNGHEFEQALGVGDGQGSLAWCSPWNCKELDTTEWLTHI